MAEYAYDFGVWRVVRHKIIQVKGHSIGLGHSLHVRIIVYIRLLKPILT